VSLTWNGEDKFNTTFGAVVTICLFAVLIGFSAFRAVDVFRKLNPMVSRTSFLRMEDDSLPYDPKNEGFDFAFGILGSNEALDPSLGFMSAQYVTRTLNNGKKSIAAEPRTFSQCGDTKFNYTDTRLIRTFGIDNMMCLNEDQRYELEGQTYYGP
jgi:hypothetical protein